MNWLTNFWGWLKVDPSRESKNIQNQVNAAGGKGISPGTDTTSPSYLDQGTGLLKGLLGIDQTLQWLTIAVAGVLVYSFIFKK